MRGRWLLILLLIPTGQGLSVDVEGPTDIRPEVDFLPMPVTIQIGCDELRTNVDPATGANQVHLRLDFPSYITVTGPTTILVGNEECTTDPFGTIEREVVYTVGATLQAPGLVSIQGFVEAQLEGGHALAETQPFRAPVALQVDYAGFMQIKVEQPLQKAAPGERLVIPVELRNFGNAATLASLHVTQAADRLEIHAEDVVVESQLNGNGSAIMDVVVDLPSRPGWNNELMTFDFEIRTVAADDPSREGDTPTGTVLIRTRGHASVGSGPLVVDGIAGEAAAAVPPYLAIMAPGVLLALAVALLARRRS